MTATDPAKTALAKQKVVDQKERLSEEDQQIKDQIEAKVETLLHSSDAAAFSDAISALLCDVRTVSGGMTSVPKPLRFVRTHYGPLADRYERFAADAAALAAHRGRYADLLAVLATVVASASVLKWRLAGTGEALSAFGTEFARALTRELPEALTTARETETSEVEELVKQVEEIVAFYARSNAEIEAIDLLAEVEMLEKLIPLVDDHNIDRVVLYLASTAKISSGEGRDHCLSTALEICLLNGRFPAGLRLALRLGDERASAEAVRRVVAAVVATGDKPTLRQLAAMLGDHGEMWKTLETLRSVGLEGEEEVMNLAQNERLARDFRRVMTELEASEAKTPEDVFKTHLEERSATRTTDQPVQLDSAKHNLACSLVNAFVNCGSAKDKLLLVEGSNWLYKTKEMGQFATAASIALLYLWDLDEGLAALDKYQWSSDVHVKAGALLGFGLVAGGRVNNDCDPALALLAEHVSGQPESGMDQGSSSLTRMAAALGLGFAYAGSRREEVRELLTILLLDGEVPLETSAMTAVALALVFVGSADAEIAAVLVQAFSDRLATTTATGSLGAGPGTLGVMFVTALGLLVLGAGANTSGVEAVQTAVRDGGLPDEVTALIQVVLEGFPAAGSGDVLVVQKMLQTLADLVVPVPAAGPAAGAAAGAAETWQSLRGGFALVGLGLSAVGEPVGEEMALRLLDHVHQFGDGTMKRGIPLVVALLNLSDPKPQVVDTLGKFAHDADTQVGLNGVLGLGLVGFGSNNARISGILRQQASFFAKDANMLFGVRIAQGFLHAGKGLVGLRMSHSDEFLMNPTATAGVVTLMTWLLGGAGVLSEQPYMWLVLGLTMRARMLVTVDAETMEPVSVTVRVGQALDVVGQAGKQTKTITGFQTHTTPVLLAPGERGELANEDWTAATPVLEGLVLVKEAQ